MWWRVSSVVEFGRFPSLPFLAYNTNLVIIDHSGATTVLHMDALGLVILAPMEFLVVAECGAVGDECRNPCMCHGRCHAITPLSSAVRHRIDHYGFGQFITGCAFDRVAAHLAYRRSAKIDC